MEFLLVVVLPIAIVVAAIYGVRRHRKRVKAALADVQIPPASMSGLTGPFGNTRV